MQPHPVKLRLSVLISGVVFLSVELRRFWRGSRGCGEIPAIFPEIVAGLDLGSNKFTVVLLGRKLTLKQVRLVKQIACRSRKTESLIRPFRIGRKAARWSAPTILSCCVCPLCEQRRWMKREPRSRARSTDH